MASNDNRHRLYSIQMKMGNAFFDWQWIPKIDFVNPLKDQINAGSLKAVIRWGHAFVIAETWLARKSKKHVL